MGEGTVESEELIELSIGSIRTMWGVSMVLRIVQVPSLAVRPFLGLRKLLNLGNL